MYCEFNSQPLLMIFIILTIWNKVGIQCINKIKCFFVIVIVNLDYFYFHFIILLHLALFCGRCWQHTLF